MNRRSFLSIPLLGLTPLSISPAVTAGDAGKVSQWVGLDLASVTNQITIHVSMSGIDELSREQIMASEKVFMAGENWDVFRARMNNLKEGT